MDEAIASGCALPSAKGITEGYNRGTVGGATLPDGQKYEDWLKSKGRGEDGENSGSS